MKVSDTIVYESSVEVTEAFKKLSSICELEGGKSYSLGTIVFSLWLKIISTEVDWEKLAKDESKKRYKEDRSKLQPGLAVLAYKKKYEKEIGLFHHYFNMLDIDEQLIFCKMALVNGETMFEAVLNRNLLKEIQSSLYPAIPNAKIVWPRDGLSGMLDRMIDNMNVNVFAGVIVLPKVKAVLFKVKADVKKQLNEILVDKSRDVLERLRIFTKKGELLVLAEVIKVEEVLEMITKEVMCEFKQELKGSIKKLGGRGGLSGIIKSLMCVSLLDIREVFSIVKNRVENDKTWISGYNYSALLSDLIKNINEKGYLEGFDDLMNIELNDVLTTSSDGFIINWEKLILANDFIKELKRNNYEISVDCGLVKVEYLESSRVLQKIKGGLRIVNERESEINIEINEDYESMGVINKDLIYQMQMREIDSKKRDLIEMCQETLKNLGYENILNDLVRDKIITYQNAWIENGSEKECYLGLKIRVSDENRLKVAEIINYLLNPPLDKNKIKLHELEIMIDDILMRNVDVKSDVSVSFIKF